MNMIRPVSDLRNNFADISNTVLQWESEIFFKLQEAEREAELTDRRYSSKDVLKAMKAAIGGI